MTRTLLVTGGSGFIGSALVLHLLEKTSYRVVNVDAMTYAANPLSLKSVEGHPRYAFHQASVQDRAAMRDLFARYSPDGVMHLAAESHVDRSIDKPEVFVETNVLGTVNLLQAALEHYRGLSEMRKQTFRFHHISTDEVFGTLAPEEPPFTEDSPYEPRSPYAASKASSDHFVQAWHHTYGLPMVMTNCSNNYGPRQSLEKFIPMMISSALNGAPLRVYGDGRQQRDWLFVEDHVEALVKVFEEGKIGQTYAIGGNNNPTNMEIVSNICAILDALKPLEDGGSYARQITHVTDRPGHDRRYAIDTANIYARLGWHPKVNLADGLRQTVGWYLEHTDWWGADYAAFSERKGLGAA